jgi:uncharacterized protein (DUF1778 family)
MKPKTAQLQIRVTAAEKTAIQRLAGKAGMDMSAYVLSRVLSAPASRFAECIEACKNPESASYGLAELNSFLSGLSAPQLRHAVAAAPSVKLTPYIANYIAAMVEYACQKQSAAPPAWACAIEPLTDPVFATALQSLRLHLLTHSPPPFRRRNIFIDSSLGDRV